MSKLLRKWLYLSDCMKIYFELKLNVPCTLSQTNHIDDKHSASFFQMNLWVINQLTEQKKSSNFTAFYSSYNPQINNTNWERPALDAAIHHEEEITSRRWHQHCKKLLAPAGTPITFLSKNKRKCDKIPIGSKTLGLRRTFCHVNYLCYLCCGSSEIVFKITSKISLCTGGPQKHQPALLCAFISMTLISGLIPRAKVNLSG